MAQNTPKEIVNRKAKFEYQFIDRYEAGIVLVGTEVKALREGLTNLTDAFCHFDKNGNLQIHNLYIGEYKYGTYNNHDTKRERRLLLNKSELKKIEKATQEKGMTMVPYKIYFTDRGFVKVEIWSAQGKKMYDKRQSMKERDTKRRLDKIMKEY